MLIRRLQVEDAEAYVRLRKTALEQTPFAFGSSPEDDRNRSTDFVRGTLASSRKAIYGAFLDGALVGIVGVAHEEALKSAHKCDVWGLYVSRDARKQGTGRALMNAVISFAKSIDGVTHVHLSVSERASEAMTLYGSLGFTTWGVEPAAIRIAGVDAAEHYMTLVLPK